MLTALLLAGVLLTGTPPLPASTPARAADPCADQGALPAEEAACGDAALCSARARVQVACEARDALEARYVFFGVKGRLLGQRAGGFDSRRHLDACIAAERAIPREDEPLRFYDRMRRCAAAFEDGHLLLGVPAGVPEVALGVGLRLAEGKVYVASRERELFARPEAEERLRALLAPGNEVLEIDGRPAGEALAALARLVPGSSPAARLERAVDALTRRDFLFPERRTATLTVSADGAREVVELPWWISPGAERHPAARRYLERTRLPTTDLLSWRGAARTDVEGVQRGDPILPPEHAAALREYLDDRGRPAVRTGVVSRTGGSAFCYLQILTFHAETLAAEEGPRRFPAVLETFVRACRERSLDLVLDLRENEGGYISHTTALAAALAAPGRTLPAGALLLRASERNQRVYEQRAPPGATASADPLDPARIAGAIGDAVRERRQFTPAFLEAPLRPSDPAGYPGRVVALVSARCMSACDRLAAMLRESGRAVLVGTATEGAGGSQQETKDLGARWTDEAGLLSLSIPNAAMGVQHGTSSPATGEAAADEFFRALALENRPVQPDVRYATRRGDLLSSNGGWLERVEAVLAGSAEAGAAGR